MYKNLFSPRLPVSQPLLSKLNIFAGACVCVLGGGGQGVSVSADSIQDFRLTFTAHHGGVKIAGWTADREIWVRFSAYPYRVLALWWQESKNCLWTSRCPCQSRLGTFKTPSCPWCWVPDSRSKLGNWTIVPSLYSWNIADCDKTTTKVPTNGVLRHILLAPYVKQ